MPVAFRSIVALVNDARQDCRKGHKKQRGQTVVSYYGERFEALHGL